MVLLIATAACASSGSGGASRPRSDRNLVRTADVTEAQKDLTVFQVLQQLRPHFLSGTNAATGALGGTGGSGAVAGDMGTAGVVVYQDGVRLGGISTLEDIRMREVVEIRYLNASEASGRFGLGHQAGAIAITRRRG
jgi:hypothetical protein